MNAPDNPLTGRCTCGELQYQLQTEPMFVHCCHCSWCQRETGSAFVLNAMIESDRLRLVTGEAALTTLPSASGKGQQVARCPQCQVVLWSHYAGAGRKISFVRVGTLDTPALCPPTAHVFTATKLPWVVLSDEAPSFETFYSRTALWSTQQLERLATVKQA